MSGTSSIFFDINLPNPTTWFYFSGLLAVALFFKFSRLWSMRNLDVLALFLPMPGLLLLAEGNAQAAPAADPAAASRAAEQEARDDEPAQQDREESARWKVRAGYLWLVCTSIYFLVRCLIDLTLVRRPALGSNLDPAGLAWLACALFASLVAVAVREDSRPSPEKSTARTPTEQVRSLADAAVQPIAPPGVTDDELRLWVERGLALLCHLSIVVGLVLIGWRHFDDLHAGMSAATFYLLLPYTYLLLPSSPMGVGRWDHPWPMALMVWTVFACRRPVLAGAFLGLAAGSAIFPLLTFPAWLSFYRGRGAGRFALSFALFAGLCLGVLGGVSYLYDGQLPAILRSAWTTFDWQPWKHLPAGTSGLWQDMPGHRAYRLPIFIAHVALVLTSYLWPAPKNLAHVLALSAAALLGIQLWYADQGGVYVLWYLPLLLLLAFRPNLEGCQPPVPPADDWVGRLGRRVRGVILRLVRLPIRPAGAEAAGRAG
jgi:hypothetical protein